MPQLALNNNGQLPHRKEAGHLNTERKTRMKFIILLFMALSMNLHAGWFSDDSQQINQLQTQLHHQQETTDHWQAAAIMLAFGTVAALLGGTAIGSKARKEKRGE